MTTDMNDVLVEIGTEELPPKALRMLSEALAAEIAAELEAAGFAHGTPVPYATPRRLAVLVPGVPGTQPDREVERRGPPLARAFDENDKPTRAALGFAKSVGVEVESARSPGNRGRRVARLSIHQGRRTARVPAARDAGTNARQAAGAAPDAVGGPRRRVRAPRALGGADARH